MCESRCFELEQKYILPLMLSPSFFVVVCFYQVLQMEVYNQTNSCAPQQVFFLMGGKYDADDHWLFQLSLGVWLCGFSRQFTAFSRFSAHALNKFFALLFICSTNLNFKIALVYYNFNKLLYDMKNISFAPHANAYFPYTGDYTNDFPYIVR